MAKGETWIGKAAFVSFLLIVFSLGLMKPAIDSPVGPLTPTDLLFPFSLLLVLTAGMLGGLTFRWHPGFWMLILFLLTLAIATIFSEDLRRSVVKLVGAGYLALLAFVAFHCATSLNRVRITILTWIAGAIMPVLIGIAAIILFYFAPGASWLGDITYHYGAVPAGHFPRVSSTMVSPSMLCNYLTVSLVLVVTAFKMDWLKTKVAAGSIAVIALVAVFTVSIALGGLVLAIGLLASSTSSRKSSGVLIAASVIAIAFLAIAPISISDVLHGSLAPSSRVLVWSDAGRTFLSNPLLGAGPGLPVANVLFRNSDGTVSLLTDAHNTFLSVAGQAGILGLAGLLAVIVAVLRSGPGSNRTYGSQVIRRGLMIAFTCAFIYDGLTGSFEDARHLWVLIGLIFAVDKMATEGEASLESA